MYLFLIYGCFILILLGIFFSFTYTHYKGNTFAEAKKDSENLCVSVNNSIQNQLDSLSTLSMNIVYSNALKSSFKEFSRLYQQTGSDPSTLTASREKAQAIHDIVTAMIGAYQSASDIKLYTMDGSCVEAGYYLKTSSVDLKSQPWYEEVLKLNGYKLFTEPFISGEIPGKDGSIGTHKFISLVRLFLDSGGQPEGIAEVIQDCDVIFSLPSQLEEANPENRVYIYNKEGRLVYPYNRTVSTNFYEEIQKKELPESQGQLMKTQDKEAYLLAYETVPGYEWTVVVTKPEAAVYLSLGNFRSLFLLIGGISILFTMFICFGISQQLTKPLQKLTNATGKITISRVLSEEKVNLTSADSRISEISLLCDSIRSMYEKLRSTSQEALLSRSEETRAKLQATQSLINPHFLYNSLTNISVMAEEDMNEDIVRICHALCDYFRYISSGQEMIVSLEKEIFYTKRYLECMKLRFGDEFEYHISIGENTGHIVIPKLILQPVVENAFKYAFANNPPWTLRISSELSSDRWLLKIEDNGGCLSDAKKAELLNLYENLDMKEELKSMQIGGMGLKNVYLRLKLLYGPQAVFQIENSIPKRTIFLVGGPVYLSKEEYYGEHPQL